MVGDRVPNEDWVRLTLILREGEVVEEGNMEGEDDKVCIKEAEVEIEEVWQPEFVTEAEAEADILGNPVTLTDNVPLCVEHSVAVEETLGDKLMVEDGEREKDTVEVGHPETEFEAKTLEEIVTPDE